MSWLNPFKNTSKITPEVIAVEPPSPQVLLYSAIDDNDPKGVIIALEAGADMRKDKHGVIGESERQKTSAYRYAESKYRLMSQNEILKTERLKGFAVELILYFANRVFVTNKDRTDLKTMGFTSKNPQLRKEHFTIHVQNAINELILRGDDVRINTNPEHDIQKKTKMFLTVLSKLISGETDPSAIEPSAIEPSAIEPSAIEPSAIERSEPDLSAIDPSAIDIDIVKRGGSKKMYKKSKRRKSKNRRSKKSRKIQKLL
jgi:hypothetical protein